MTSVISPNIGGAYFNDTQFYGINNSTIYLNFNITNEISSFYLIQGTSCSILLYGCEDGQKIQASSEGDYDTCVAEHYFSSNTIIAFFLSLSTIILSCLLLIIITVSVYRYYRKKIIRNRLLATEIPDFTGKPSVTLDDILNDPSIPRLNWEDIIISDVIGKGASGLVSKGTWKSSNTSKEKDIALKELLFGFQDFGMEVLDEFLIEIKYMR